MSEQGQKTSAFDINSTGNYIKRALSLMTSNNNYYVRPQFNKSIFSLVFVITSQQIKKRSFCLLKVQRLVKNVSFIAWRS